MPRAVSNAWTEREGSPAPLGATLLEDDGSINFALYSRSATAVTLLCYLETDPVHPVFTYHFDHRVNKTGRIWHCRLKVSDLRGATLYAYRVDGPYDPPRGHRFDAEKILLDPYARNVFFPAGFSRLACSRPGPTDGLAPLGRIPLAASQPANGAPAPRHTSDAIIYELHVKGFTARANSGITTVRRGTFAALAVKIPYLVDLGVTIVELMPVHQFEPNKDDYWGYMTLNFFSPNQAYANGDAAEEFSRMVEAFHDAGIEVWLDVVFNHTSEGNHLGPTYSMRGIDNSSYYLLQDGSMAEYVNETGCGNTTRCAHPAMRELIIDSLRYWTTEMGIDGYRFDLASVFTLETGSSEPPIIAEIGAFAAQNNVSLVAEAWDVDTYQLGRSFPGITWSQWNDRFRNDVRCFVKSDEGFVPALMRRLYGSDDLFPDNILDAYRPVQSINYVTSHDGFCLADLVSYTRASERSWDCGWEDGHSVPQTVQVLRKKQVKNFFTLTMLSNGIPMFVAGDEFMNTQMGHDNPFDQDNETTWLDWDLLESNADIHRFFRLMIAFRKAHPTIGRSRFWREDVTWYGVHGAPDLGQSSHALAYCLNNSADHDDSLYVMINAYWDDLVFDIQEGAPGSWLRVVDTARQGPDDILECGAEEVVATTEYRVAARSIVVLRQGGLDG